MKQIDRINVIDKIGRELQSRMTYADINAYLGGYGIDCNVRPSSNSKWVYVKEILANVGVKLITTIASELEIKHPAINSEEKVKTLELNFWKAGYFRLFISHLAEHKVKISALKNTLEDYCISGFVAHEDIEPTKEWQDEIEKALFSMEALVAILSPKFNESKWTDQEIGVALGRDLLIVPVRNGLDPYGFIGKYQGFQSSGKKVGEVALRIFEILSTNDKTSEILLDKLVSLIILSRDFKEAVHRIELLDKFKIIPEGKISFLHSGIIDNPILGDKNVLIQINKVFEKYGFNKRTLQDFDKTNADSNSDLPF